MLPIAPHSRALFAAALLVLACIPGLARLELRTDGHALVPQGRPEVRYDREVRARFGVRDPVVVVLHSRDPRGIYNPATLADVRRLSEALARLPGVGPADVTSLATEVGFDFRPGSLLHRNLLDVLPETPEQLARLRTDVDRLGLYDGLLVSRDRRAAAVLVGVPPDADRGAFYAQVLATVETLGLPAGEVDVLGAPVAETLLGDHILEDLGVPAAWRGGGQESLARPAGRLGMVPLALAAMTLVFFAGFRRPLAALLPLAKLGSILVVILGLMGYLGVPIFLTTAVMPVVLIAVGVADEVHLLRRFKERAAQEPGAPAIVLVRRVLGALTVPVIQTSVTTAVGFFSFAFSAIAPVRSFGLWTALGVMLCLAWSLTVTPALLALLPPRFWVRPGPPAAGIPGTTRAAGSGRVFPLLARLALRRRLLLGVAAVALVLAVDGWRRLEVQDSWIDGFDPATPFARAMRRFEGQFGGAHRLLAVVEGEPLRLEGEIRGADIEDDRVVVPARPRVIPARLAGAVIRVEQVKSAAVPEPRDWSAWVETVETTGDHWILRLPKGAGSPRFWMKPTPGEPIRYQVELRPFEVPALLGRVGELETYLAGRPGVGATLGPAAVLEAAATVIASPRPPRHPLLPERQRDLAYLWQNTGTALGEERLSRLVDADDFSRTLVTAFLRNPNYESVGRLLDDLRDFERRRLAPLGLRLHFAGDVAVSQALIGSVVTTQVQSLGLSLIGILLVAAGLGRSWRFGFLSLVAPTFAVLLNFAVMGWTGIPLGVATSMFAGMTLGVGIDYSIHLLARHRAAKDAGAPPEEALATTLAEVGPAIVLDAASVGLGFAVLLLSQVPANARLAGLLVLCVWHSMAATFLLVPALAREQK